MQVEELRGEVGEAGGPKGMQAEQELGQGIFK